MPETVSKSSEVHVAGTSAAMRQRTCELVEQLGWDAVPVESLDDSDNSSDDLACAIVDLPITQTCEFGTPVQTDAVVIGKVAVVRKMQRAVSDNCLLILTRPYHRDDLRRAVQSVTQSDACQWEQQANRSELLECLNSLKKRDRDIVAMIYNGAANKVIAKSLDISVRTVETARRRILAAMQAKTVVDLVRSLAQAGYDGK